MRMILVSKALEQRRMMIVEDSGSGSGWLCGSVSTMNQHFIHDPRPGE
jgi:hypothetical protein